MIVKLQYLNWQSVMELLDCPVLAHLALKGISMGISILWGTVMFIYQQFPVIKEVALLFFPN